MSRLDTSQLALIRTQLWTKRTDFHHITVRFEEKNECVLEFKVSTKFAWMKQVVFYVKGARPLMSSSSGMKNKPIDLQKSSQEVVKN